MTSSLQLWHAPDLHDHCRFLFDLYITCYKHWNLLNLHPPLHLKCGKTWGSTLGSPESTFDPSLLLYHAQPQATLHDHCEFSKLTSSPAIGDHLIFTFHLFSSLQKRSSLSIIEHRWLHVDRCALIVIDLSLTTYQNFFFLFFFGLMPPPITINSTSPHSSWMNTRIRTHNYNIC